MKKKPKKEVKELYANFRDAKIIQVLKVEVNEGKETPEDPISRVAYIVTLEGRVLAKVGEDKERSFAGGDEMFDFN